jgi:hypothetical protein
MSHHWIQKYAKIQNHSSNVSLNSVFGSNTTNNTTHTSQQTTASANPAIQKTTANTGINNANYVIKSATVSSASSGIIPSKIMSASVTTATASTVVTAKK